MSPGGGLLIGLTLSAAPPVVAANIVHPLALGITDLLPRSDPYQGSRRGIEFDSELPARELINDRTIRFIGILSFNNSRGT
jgi:hypothetical protein